MACPPQVWDGVLRRLAHELSPLALSAWITPIHAEAHGLVLRLSCPSAFHRDRVRDRFLARIEELASEAAGEPTQVSLAIAAAPRPTSSARDDDAREARDAAPPRLVAIGAMRAPEHRPRSIARVNEPTPLAPPPADLPHHTFESFVVGPGNALAREACVALAQGRQLAMSPLYLVAPHGEGKTHLAAAVVNEAREQSSARVVFASGEQFTNELLAAIRANRTAEFKARYRRDCDLLVLEDIHFVRGKRQTQLELLHTLESLAQRGARVLLTAERLPKEIPDLDARLASRMASGLCAEIETPDADLRRAILRSKAAAGGVRLPDGAIERLVAVPGSVRDLEAVLIQIVASAVRAVERGLLERAPLRYKIEALIARLDTLAGHKQPGPKPHRPA